MNPKEQFWRGYFTGVGVGVFMSIVIALIIWMVNQ